MRVKYQIISLLDFEIHPLRRMDKKYNK